MTYYLDTRKLAHLVRSKRDTKGLREIGQLIGVSPSTLSRVENCKMPDMETFLALCNWLQVPPSELFTPQHELDAPGLGTPEIIAITLHADKNLQPTVAKVLAALVKAAYKEFSSD